MATSARSPGKMHKVAARHGERAEAERRASAAIGTSLICQGQDDGIDSSGFRPVVGGSVEDAPAVVEVEVEPDAGPRGEAVDAGWTPPPPPKVTGRKWDSCRESDECRNGLTCQDYQRLGGGKWSRGVCREPPAPVRFSNGILTAGGIALGLSASAAVILTVTGNGLLGFTLGAILAALGLLALLVGLIVRATGH